MIITNYHMSDIKNFEDFLNKLFIGLSYYQRKNPNMRFKLKYGKDSIELTTTIIDDHRLN